MIGWRKGEREEDREEERGDNARDIVEIEEKKRIA